MEVGPVSHSQPPKPVMPVQVKKTAPVKTAAKPAQPVTNNKNVNFNKGGDEDEKKREKYLTAKYVLYRTALYCTVQCYQVRGAPDGAHQEAAQGGDVDLRPAAGALRDRGQQSCQQF